MTQPSPDNMEIAGHFTVADWKAMKTVLESEKSSVEIWKLAFEIFFRTRIETRYFEPIKLLQEHGKKIGEGFSIVTLQCSLIEFLASTRSGKSYKFRATESERKKKFKYSSGRLLFINFLREVFPFNAHFFQLAGCFYTHVRCALLHEARTKGSWIVRADSGDGKIVSYDSSNNEKTLYRNNLQKAFEQYIDSYGKELKSCPELQAAFIRKFDSLCEE